MTPDSIKQDMDAIGSRVAVLIRDFRDALHKAENEAGAATDADAKAAAAADKLDAKRKLDSLQAFELACGEVRGVVLS